MSPDTEFVDNLKSLIDPYFKKSSNEWWWETPLVEFVKWRFKIEDRPGGNTAIPVRSGKSRGTVRGTGSTEWNAVIAATGNRIRQKENPHHHDYRPSTYSGDAARMTVARLAAEILRDEIDRAGLSHIFDDAQPH